VSASALARVTIVWSTVSRSRVELSARLTSPSAVSSSTERVSACVRASNSLKRRTFSMAITAWLAKVLSNSICLSENAPASAPVTVTVPIGVPSYSIGTARTLR
jgi:hypothetical protein